MRVRYLDSDGIESFPEAMMSAAAGSTELDVAAAFLTRTGAAHVLRLAAHLKGAKSKRRVRVLCGTWMGITEPSALRQLRRTPGVALRIAKVPGFHVKHCAFRSAKRVVTFTGSANFTAKGLGGTGELVVEVSDSVGSSTASLERDQFRRLWEGGYPDNLTDQVIEEFEKTRKPHQFPIERGSVFGKHLLKRFGGPAKKAAYDEADGSILWFPIYGSLTNSTVAAIQAETGNKTNEPVGLASKSTYDRIEQGTRLIWILDLRGRPQYRRLTYHRIVDHLKWSTPQDGHYFALVSRALREIRLTKPNKQELKALGLVDRIDSLACKPQVLRPGANSKGTSVWSLSSPPRKR